MIISKQRQYQDTASIREPDRCCRLNSNKGTKSDIEIAPAEAERALNRFSSRFLLAHRARSGLVVW
jgi:hypothetical protein